MAACEDFTLLQGKTFSRVIRWETSPIVYKAISAIQQVAPARLTVTAHGAVDGWRAAVVSVKGMSEINAVNEPPRKDDYKPVTVLDANTVEFNDINAADFHAYTSGGYLQYNTPTDLTGFTARMSIKDKIGCTVLHSLTTENGGIALDNVNKTITLTIAATETDDFAWTRGVYDLEMVSPLGVVTCLLCGKISVTKEVTTA